MANGNKSADNPTGQNINVTFNPNAVGGMYSGGLVAHEGSHVADGSDWVKSGFSRSMNPTSSQTEFNAYHVQFNVTNVIRDAFVAAWGMTSYTNTMGTPHGYQVQWGLKDTFKMITPGVQQMINQEYGTESTKPAFTKGSVLQP